MTEQNDNIVGDGEREEYPLPEDWIINPDPAVESIRQVIYRKAAYYRLAVSVLTGRFDKSFTEWLENPTGVDMGIVENVPSIEEMVEWMHIDASLASLLDFKSAISKLQSELHLAIFGKYAAKNVRGKIYHKLEDLKGLREELKNVLDGTLTMAKSVPMLSAITPELLESIPEVGKRKPFGESLVWNFPDAPNPEKTNTDKAAAAAGTNLRKHNTNVKFVVDGKLPESDLTVPLGDLCGKYFDKSTQEVGKTFGGWAKEYFAEDGKEPQKAVERNGRRFWLTYHSK